MFDVSIKQACKLPGVSCNVVDGIHITRVRCHPHYMSDWCTRMMQKQFMIAVRVHP